MATAVEEPVSAIAKNYGDSASAGQLLSELGPAAAPAPAAAAAAAPEDEEVKEREKEKERCGALFSSFFLSF